MMTIAKMVPNMRTTGSAGISPHFRVGGRIRCPVSPVSHIPLRVFALHPVIQSSLFLCMTSVCVLSV